MTIELVLKTYMNLTDTSGKVSMGQNLARATVPEHNCDKQYTHHNWMEQTQTNLVTGNIDGNK